MLKSRSARPLPAIPRLLILAPPGKGKSWLLWECSRRYYSGGVIIDPIGELEKLGLGCRWDHVRLSWLPDPEIDADEYVAFVKHLSTENLPAGNALLIDEAARFVPNVAHPENTPVFAFLDVARNEGVRFALAEKYARRLPPLVTDLVTHIAFQPFRGPRAREWLASADIPDDLEPFAEGFGRWYVMPASGDILGDYSTEEIAEAFSISNS